MQAQRDQRAQVVALVFCAVDGVLQTDRVPHVQIVECDVVIPHQHQMWVRHQFIAYPLAQAFEPLHLVFELVAAGLLTIGKIGPDNSNISTGYRRGIRGADDTRHIVGKARNILHHVPRRCARQQRDAVIGFLTEPLAVVADALKRFGGKFVVGQLQFLQRQYVNRIGSKPFQDLRQAHAE